MAGFGTACHLSSKSESSEEELMTEANQSCLHILISRATDNFMAVFDAARRRHVHVHNVDTSYGRPIFWRYSY